MGIKDRDALNAFETLTTEFENLEATIADNDLTIVDLEEQNEKLQCEVEDLKEKIKELEEALAEAYLTSESEADEELPGEDVVLPAGCRPYVSHSTGDETID